jgi:acetolactate synthase-1/2/3 large subunit
MKLSNYVFKLLKEQGIDTVFYNSGGMIMHLVDSLHSSGIKAVHCLTEHSSICSAIAYSMTNNKLGVVLTTNGAGITNLVTGMTASYIDSVPLLVISGECKIEDFKKHNGIRSRGVAEIDAQNLMKPITKFTYMVTSNNKTSIDNILIHGIHTAKKDRKGGVFIQIPIDIQAKELIENDYKKEFYEMLKKAKRPVIIAGHGVMQSQEQFFNFLKLVKIPVMLTWRAMGLMDNDDKLFFGRSGLVSNRTTNWIEESTDLIISMGARMDLMQTSWKKADYAINAKKIVIDTDYYELMKFEFEGLKITQDFNYFMTSFLIKYNDDLKKLNYNSWIKSCNMIKKSNKKEFKQDENKPIDMYSFIDKLSDLSTKDDIIIPSSAGLASEITQQTWKVKKGQKFICCTGLGSMGFALPMAIGASIEGNKRVICIEGDGSFQYNIQDLQMIKKHNIMIFVLNNGGYGSIKNTHEIYFKENPVKDLELCNFEKIAKAYNITYKKIYNLNNLENIFKLGTPVIIEVLINNEQKRINNL